MFNGFCGFVFECIRSFEVVKIAEVNYQNLLSTESIVQRWASLYLICIIIIKNSVSSFQMQFFSTWSLEIIPASFKNGSTYEAAI